MVICLSKHTVDIVVSDNQIYNINIKAIIVLWPSPIYAQQSLTMAVAKRSAQDQVNPTLLLGTSLV